MTRRHAGIALVLSLTSTFASLAIMANVAALLLYIICCAAAWELMRRNVRTETPPFTFPGAWIVPILSLIAIVWILSHATAWEFEVNGAVFLVGSTLYFIQKIVRGRKTASGETFDTYQALTAAHRTLPFNTLVRVTNKSNGRQVDVRINDRGPFIDGRVIDLSLRAAREIDLVQAGIAPVKLKILKPGEVTRTPPPTTPAPSA